MSTTPRPQSPDGGFARMLEVALADASVVARYRAKIVLVEGSDCWWWLGAIAGRGHGRFWVGQRPGGAGHWVMIAHRFGYALAHGVTALEAAPMLGHECDNPLCQNPGHVGPRTTAENAGEWSTRRHRVGGPLRDTRGARGRAMAIRDALLAGADLETAVAAGDGDRAQLSLF